MKLPTNNIPSHLSTLSEAGHERTVGRRDERRQDSRLPPQPMIKLIQLLPCNDCHCRFPSERNAPAEACYENHTWRPRLPSSHERRGTQSYLNYNVSHAHSPVVLTSRPLPIPCEETPSTHIISPLNHASTPMTPTTRVIQAREGEIRIQREVRDIPSSSTLSSSDPNPSINRLPRASARQNPARGTACPAQGGMSERAAEMVRIMEWAKERVKAGGKTAREHERAQNEERVFFLWLKIWEAEMKFRRLMEDEGEKREETGHEGGCLELGDSRRGEQPQMGKLRNLMWGSRRRWLRGLATVLSR